VKRPAVFLDRDDTLIGCSQLPPPPLPGKRGDLIDPWQARLLPGVAEGCARLVAAGYQLVVFTNQGCVARGAASLRTVETVNDAVRLQLNMPELPFYYCPFHPQGNVTQWVSEHAWRKPAGGMLLAAADEWRLDLTRSWAIGDAQRDIEAAIAAGVPRDRCLLLGNQLTFPAACSHIMRLPLKSL